MREIIGFNMICAAIAFIIIVFTDLDNKVKVGFMFYEIVTVAVLSCGAYLLAGGIG